MFQMLIHIKKTQILFLFQIAITTLKFGRVELLHQSEGLNSVAKLQVTNISTEECPYIPWDEFQVSNYITSLQCFISIFFFFFLYFTLYIFSFKTAACCFNQVKRNYYFLNLVSNLVYFLYIIYNLKKFTCNDSYKTVNFY